MIKWIRDPQGRDEIEKVTEVLKLPVWQAWYKGKFREFWNESWGKIEKGYNAHEEKLKTLNKQEIEQILGFNTLSKDFILATLEDIKNLFPGGHASGGTFELEHISSDSTKIVNMMLLSNYNEYLQHKLLKIEEFFNNLNQEKANNTIKIIVGDGLHGGGNLQNNIDITVEKLTADEIQILLNNWR